MNKHLKIWFIDGTEEELPSKYDKIRNICDGALYTYESNSYGPDINGPVYMLVNIRKYQWLEGLL